ncbi:MAG: hypothetical protein KGI68_08970, partial [Alphaproteobacteria bacterium]|nr:hypothetical protein [Alphaproteobacteria bacterium]
VLSMRGLPHPPLHGGERNRIEVAEAVTLRFPPLRLGGIATVGTPLSGKRSWKRRSPAKRDISSGMGALRLIRGTLVRTHLRNVDEMLRAGLFYLGVGLGFCSSIVGFVSSH